MKREWYLNKSKEINSIVKELENRFEYHITNHGLGYHPFQKDIFQHTWYRNGDITQCIKCGHTIEKKLKLVKN